MTERPPFHARGEQVHLNVSRFQLRFQDVPLRRSTPCLASSDPSSSALALQSPIATARNILAPLAHSPAHVLEEDVVVHHGSVRVPVHRYKLCFFANARAACARFVRDGARQGTCPSRAPGACVNGDAGWTEYTTPRLRRSGTRHDSLRAGAVETWRVRTEIAAYDWLQEQKYTSSQ